MIGRIACVALLGCALVQSDPLWRGEKKSPTGGDTSLVPDDLGVIEKAHRDENAEFQQANAEEYRRHRINKRGLPSTGAPPPSWNPEPPPPYDDARHQNAQLAAQRFADANAASAAGSGVPPVGFSSPPTYEEPPPPYSEREQPAMQLPVGASPAGPTASGSGTQLTDRPPIHFDFMSRPFPPPYSDVHPSNSHSVPQRPSGTQDAIPARSASFGPYSREMQCPKCLAMIRTRIKKKITDDTHVAALRLFITGWCIFSPLPYCMDSYLAIKHYCPSCEAFLGARQPHTML